MGDKLQVGIFKVVPKLVKVFGVQYPGLGTLIFTLLDPNCYPLLLKLGVCVEGT